MVKAIRTRKKKTEKTTEYNIVPPVNPCRVVVIEVVIHPDSSSFDDALDDILEYIRGYGAAGVIKTFHVSTDFDETADILQRRVY